MCGLGSLLFFFIFDRPAKIAFLEMTVGKVIHRGHVLDLKKMLYFKRSSFSTFRRTQHNTQKTKRGRDTGCRK